MATNKIDIATWLIPAAILILIGALIGGAYDAEGVYYATLGSAGGTFILWSAMLWAMGFMLIRQPQFCVIERFGRFHSVKYPGWRWRNPFFDQIKLKESLAARGFRLYRENEQKAQLDFIDSSACILVWAWYSIANPVDVKNENWDAVTAAIKLWTYEIEPDARERALSIFDGELRFRLQQLTTDDAGKAGGEQACEAAARAAAPLLAAIGAYPLANKALIIEDIALPETTQDLRDMQLEAERTLSAAALVFQAPARAIAATLKASEDADGKPTISAEYAGELVRQTQVLEALKVTRSNVTFIASGVTGVMQQLEPPKVQEGG